MSIVFAFDAVHGGKPAGVGANAYSAGNATSGAEEAERFKRRWNAISAWIGARCSSGADLVAIYSVNSGYKKLGHASVSAKALRAESGLARISRITAGRALQSCPRCGAVRRNITRVQTASIGGCSGFVRLFVDRPDFMMGIINSIARRTTCP